MIETRKIKSESQHHRLADPYEGARLGAGGGSYSQPSLLSSPLLPQEKCRGRSSETLQRLDVRWRERLGSWEELWGCFPISNQVNCSTKCQGILRSLGVYRQVMGPADVWPQPSDIAAEPLGAGAKGPPAVLAAPGAGGTAPGRTLVAPEPGAPFPPRP